jgi:hypothetical protein
MLAPWSPYRLVECCQFVRMVYHRAGDGFDELSALRLVKRHGQPRWSGSDLRFSLSSLPGLTRQSIP